MAKYIYKYDAFVSFSHLDDKSPNGRGWVTAFCSGVDTWLSRRLGRPASIWHDSKLTGQRLFDDTIQQAIDDSAVLLVLYSAAYESSSYCAKEREWFARKPITVGDQSRVLKVRLVNIPHERWPKEFRGSVGFDFFRATANDPMGFPLSPDNRTFDKQVKNVVVGIEAVLRALEEAPDPDIIPAPSPLPLPPPSARPITVAHTDPQEDPELAVLRDSFKIDFQKCFTQIKVLTGRKDLHDQLHELQFKFYIPVLESLPAAGTAIDGQLLDIVRDHYFTLSEILDNLREVEARKCLPIQELTWLKEVAEARTMLDESIRRLDLASLGAAVRKIERVLAVWPSKMNAKLTENARELTLVSLAKKLQLLCEKSATFKRQLGDKARELEELEQRISDLVATHDDWQSFDDQLRLLDTTLTQSFRDIEEIWPGLRGKAATLCAQNSDTWAERLVYWGGQMDQALKRQSIADAKKCFIRFSSAARKRFYSTDQSLKSGCQRLQQVGDPIEALLKAG